jgi:hypothetical protein
MKALQVIKEEGIEGFMKRWKEGINKITPLQQTNSQILFTRITLVGITCGFFVGLYSATTLWWLAIIMGGAFGNTYIGLIALKQKRNFLIQVEGGVENV